LNNEHISQWVTTVHVSITEGCSFNAERRKSIIWHPRKKKNECNNWPFNNSTTIH